MEQWITQQTLKDVQRLAKSTCANFTGQDGCLYAPIGCSQCFYFRELAEGQQVQRCKYFEEAVLPNDSVLETAYQQSLGEYLSGNGEQQQETCKCKRCNKTIVKRSNRTSYCVQCKSVAERQSKARRMARYRQSKQG